MQEPYGEFISVLSNSEGGRLIRISKDKNVISFVVGDGVAYNYKYAPGSVDFSLFFKNGGATISFTTREAASAFEANLLKAMGF